MRSIILVGFPGSGKTYLGKKIADVLDLKFIDTDHEIENRVRKSIDIIFRLYGEKYFRHIEKCVVNDICDISNVVIATGGGTIIDYSNYLKLQKHFIVYVYCPFEICLQRIRMSERPLKLLSNKQLKKLYMRRNIIYIQRSNLIVNATNGYDICIDLLLRRLK